MIQDDLFPESPPMPSGRSIDETVRFVILTIISSSSAEKDRQCNDYYDCVASCSPGEETVNIHCIHAQPKADRLHVNNCNNIPYGPREEVLTIIVRHNWQSIKWENYDNWSYHPMRA